MTIPEQIKNKLQLKENYEVEYKSAAGGFPVKEFWITFSAFANTNGGTIVLGVKQKGKQFIPDGLSEELVGKYRKQFWDDAHNKSCVNYPMLVESDVQEFETEGGHSICRNPLLQKMFVFIGIGEKGGTGADVIAKGWTDNGWAIPTLCEKTAPDRVEAVLYVSDNTTETTTVTTETTTETTTVTTETTTETIRQMIKDNPKITGKELASRCGVTEDGVAYHIKKLKAAGRIIRKGSARNGGEWEVV